EEPLRSGTSAALSRGGRRAASLACVLGARSGPLVDAGYRVGGLGDNDRARRGGSCGAGCRTVAAALLGCGDASVRVLRQPPTSACTWARSLLPVASTWGRARPWPCSPRSSGHSHAGRPAPPRTLPPGTSARRTPPRPRARLARPPGGWESCRGSHCRTEDPIDL